MGVHHHNEQIVRGGSREYARSLLWANSHEEVEEEGVHTEA